MWHAYAPTRRRVGAQSVSAVAASSTSVRKAAEGRDASQRVIAAGVRRLPPFGRQAERNNANGREQHRVDARPRRTTPLGARNVV